MLLRTNIAIITSLLISSCGGSDGGGGDCNATLTADYIQNEFNADFIGFTLSGTTIVHSDGNQGNLYDIDTIAVSRTTYNSDNSLAFSYTVYGTIEPPTGTYTAFFIDADKDIATGMVDGTMGADALVVNAAGGSANGYYTWSDVGAGSWVKQATLGSLGSNASYFQGCSYSTTIYAPLYTGLDLLYSKPVTGVMKVVTIIGSDPTNITSILDSSSQFNFTMP